MFIVTAASQELAEVLAHVLVLDGGIGMRSEVRDGVYTGRSAGPFTYREGKAEAIRAARRGAGDRPLRVLRLLRLRVRPPDDAGRGAPGGGEPGLRLERTAREEGWRIMRFDKLARHLKVAGVVGTLALVGGSGGYLAARLRPRPRRRLPGLR